MFHFPGSIYVYVGFQAIGHPGEERASEWFQSRITDQSLNNKLLPSRAVLIKLEQQIETVSLQNHPPKAKTNHFKIKKHFYTPMLRISANR